MTTLTPIAVGRAARSPLTRARHAIAAWLRTRRPRVPLNHESGHLSKAGDPADLERRLRALERCDITPPC